MEDVVVLNVEMHKELKELVGVAADNARTSLVEFVSRVLAREVGHPELGGPPRKGRPGRPRKELTNGHTNGHKKRK